jgi:glucose-6-phosphate 1-dehydrogenase
MTDHSHLPADHSRRADAIVIFGVTGDLVAKKLFPALHALALNDRLNVPVIGVGRSGWTDTALRAAARASLPTTDREGATAFQSLSTRLRMVSGDYADHRTYEDISEQLAGAQQPVFYLATPPSLSPVIAEGLRKSGLADTARVVIEKPFGRDLGSAVMLERRLRDTFADENIFRVDHYLAKEPVEGLQILRFDNELFEPIWNRNHIAAVEVTLAEELGTEHRPGFYDEAGAIRDVLQNHVLQIVALLAMERPVDDTADAFHEAQARLLRQIRPLSSTDTLRGQYDGYRDQVGVASNSTTETFVAAQLCIDSDRWAGVPFRVRAGKRMAQTATEAVVIFKRPSRLTSVQPAGALADPDVVRLRLGSDDGVTIVDQRLAG